jgi:hypothetical protein
MLGKLSRLPAPLREQLNLRLANNEPARTILAWLNALPEVRAILKAFFDGKPIRENNLTEYRQRGFRRSQMYQDALEFSAESHPDLPPQKQIPPERIIHQLVQWISLRFAAAAHNANIPDDAQADLREIRQLLTDIVSLRRGELISRRIHLEEQRLSLEQTKNKEALEKLFWDWTKRPDIQAKLYPYRDPDKIRRDTVRLIDRELLGIRRHDDDDPEPDPAALI